MKRVICWKPDDVYAVVNIDADAVPPSVFWAVDTDAPIHVREGIGGSPSEVTTNVLIERFLNPDRGHAQMAVLGPSGAGKSHLIRRLQRRIEGREGLEVLVVERLETNLRSIIDLLIARLPVVEQTRYRNELAGAGHALVSPEVQKGALLDGLAQAIQDDHVRSDSGIDPEAEAFLLDALPNLFRDPYLRKQKWLLDGEVVPELVDRLFSSREGKRVDERLLFTRENLPIDGISLLECAAPVRDAVSFYLYDSDNTVPPVLSVINRNLDRAIARTLNFSGERLVELMGDIREHLFRQKKELILLFEEFARLQGYDGSMLEALLKTGQPDGAQPSCRVRWAIACTSGRFEELPETVRLRMDFVVDMKQDPPAIGLDDFAGKYLNAVRLGRGRLDADLLGGAPSPTNACDECPWQPECHPAFGHSGDGYGLYPFTSTALASMVRRKGNDADGRLNPRLFQRHVLQMILADEGRRIAEDAFPSKSLMDKLGGDVISTGDRVRLMERAGARYDRYLSLTQFWSDGRLANPSDGVLAAFGLEALADLSEVASRAPDPLPKVNSNTIPTRGVRTDRYAHQLADWVNGGRLDQTLAGKLRNVLFKMVDRTIDWDMEKLIPTVFSGATSNRPFRQQSIHFLNQDTGGGQGGSVRIVLPLKSDAASFANTAAALEVMLRYEESGHWDHDGGLESLAAMRELVDECAEEVISQMRSLRTQGPNWDPVIGAFELLLITAALGGAVTSTMSDDEILVAVFDKVQDDSSGFSAATAALYELLKAKRSDLMRLVIAHVSGSKGGKAGRFIDPVDLLAAVRRLRRAKWTLAGQPFASPLPYLNIDTWYGKVQSELRSALEIERTLRVQWLMEIEEAFGSEENRANILDAIKSSLDAAIEAGLPMSRTPLETAMVDFRNVRFATAVQAARTVRAADPAESELPTFGRGARSSAVKSSRTLIKAWQDFLSKAEAEANVRRAQQHVAVLDDELRRLDSALLGIEAELEGMEEFVGTA